MQGLRKISEQILAQSLEDPDLFGYPLKITRVDTNKTIGDEPLLYGQTGEIGASIDPDTGVLVASEFAHASVRMSTLIERGFMSPDELKHVSIMESWIVEFANINDLVARYVIDKSIADHTLGFVSFNLSILK
ncbi:hypothetical protein WAX88_16050 [Photobacterium damselae subsp. damselae]|uniref:hypothetical protein n=1 Tax=Photobacterium damselae TaxID=38293 RepID=UPI00311B2416